MVPQQLLAYPIMEKLEYRQKIDPDQLNVMLRSLEESVLRSLLKCTEITDQMESLSLGVYSSYMGLAYQDQKINQFLTNTSGVLFATAFDPISSAVDVPCGRSNDTCGLLTLNWETARKMSKIPRQDEIVSPSVLVYVDSNLRSSEDSVYNIFNKSNSSFWIESVSNTSTTHTLEIQLPTAINKKFNYIEILPFPLFGIEITQIDYQNELSITNSIYPTDDTVFYTGSGPLILHLAPKSFNGTIKIYYTVKENIGAMGFSNIDVGFIDYNNTDQTSYLPFYVPTDLGNVILTNMDLDFYVDGTTDFNSVITEIALVTSIGGSNIAVLKPVRTAQTLGNISTDLSGGVLYLKIKMREKNFTSPVFRGAKLTYTRT